MGRAWTPDEEQRGCDLYALGFATAAVGELLGRPESSVQTMLKRNGVKKRARGLPVGATRMDHASVVKAAFLYERMGMSVNEVAEAMDLHFNSVYHRLHVAGVKLRDQSESQRLSWARRRRTKTKETA